jgi:predicted transcriptional regulator
MTSYEMFKKEKEDIKKKLSTVVLQEGQETSLCWQVATALKISGTTVNNYLRGNVSDGFMAEAIYREFKKLKCIK